MAGVALALLPSGSATPSCRAVGELDRAPMWRCLFASSMKCVHHAWSSTESPVAICVDRRDSSATSPMCSFREEAWSVGSVCGTAGTASWGSLSPNYTTKISYPGYWCERGRQSCNALVGLRSPASDVDEHDVRSMCSSIVASSHAMNRRRPGTNSSSSSSPIDGTTASSRMRKLSSR